MRRHPPPAPPPRYLAAGDDLLVDPPPFFERVPGLRHRDAFDLVPALRRAIWTVVVVAAAVWAFVFGAERPPNPRIAEPGSTTTVAPAPGGAPQQPSPPQPTPQGAPAPGVPVRD